MKQLWCKKYERRYCELGQNKMVFFIFLVSDRLTLPGQWMYGIQLPHIFKISSISNENYSLLLKIPSILIENLRFRSKY